MRKDPTAFRERFKKWKETGEYELPKFEDGYESFLKTLPKNQRTPGAYNTRRYWELNGKPKDFAEAIGKGMYAIQNDNGVLGWHANSVAYNESNDTYEFMKPNYHPTRWLELVEGYDQSPEFQKDYKVLYNGPMLSDRYIRREKPGLKVKGGLLPKFAIGTEGNDTEEYHPIITPMRAAKNAVNFAKRYYNSEGFNQRFKNINKATKGFLYSQYNPAAIYFKEDGYIPHKHTWSIEKKPIEVNSITPTTGSNAYYNPYTKSIKFGDSGTLKLGIVKTWDEVMAHEAGHALEDAIKLRNSVLKEELDNYNNGYGYPYANIYPIFRKSKSYQKVRNFFLNYGDATDLKLYERDPSYGTYLMRDGELHHDAIPSESYADLFQMRKMLYDQKIFDSTKAGIKFTKEHLDKFKKKNHIRLLDNFSDDDIIWMINNVASNRTHTDNEV